MLDDTYLKLEIDTSFPQYAALSTTQLSSMVVGIGGGNNSFIPFIPPGSEYGSEGMTGLAGHTGRLNPTNAAIQIGRNGLELSVDALRSMNTVHVARLADEVIKGKLTVKLLNRGETVGSAGTPWRDGATLTGSDIQRRGMAAQKLWDNITDNQDPAALLTSAELFMYLPRLGGTLEFLIDPISVAGAGPLTVDLYGWSVAASKPYLIETNSVALSGTELQKITTDAMDPFVIMVITAGLADGDDVDVYAGFKLEHQ